MADDYVLPGITLGRLRELLSEVPDEAQVHIRGYVADSQEESVTELLTVAVEYRRTPGDLDVYDAIVTLS